MEIEVKGPRYDRRWMLVDDQNKFISQRNKPEITHFEVGLHKETITISEKDDQLIIPTHVQDGESEKVELWKSEITCIEPNKEYSEWFAKKLNTKCKLVYMRDEDARMRSMLKMSKKKDVSFADGYPYLFLGTQSLDHLNSKLEKHIPIDRFRANVILETKVEHAEDELDKIGINQIQFRMIKPCARCTVITTDQETGEINPEPLQVLKTYRKKSNKIYFGMNAVALDSGFINVGDQLLQL